MDIDMDTDLIAQQLRALGIEIRQAFSAGALSLDPSQVVCTGAENWA
jgi:hypothetical protein